MQSLSACLLRTAKAYSSHCPSSEAQAYSGELSATARLPAVGREEEATRTLGTASAPTSPSAPLGPSRDRR
eukprot:9442460-Pyramimonas_sp.AAC.1